jgi:hypothetical protein
VSAAYTVWDRAAALRAGAQVLVVIGLLLVTAVVTDRLLPLVAVPVMVVVGVVRVRRAGRLLVVGGVELVLRQRRTPWRSVDMLRLRRDEVELVLSSEAPLPPWERARISDPADPADRMRLHATVPGLDPERLQAALRRTPAAHRVVVESAA